MHPRVLIFASGTKTGGGSGVRNLLEQRVMGIVQMEPVAVVSNHENGGVRAHAEAMGVPFHHMGPPWDETSYLTIIKKLMPDFIVLSGWLKLLVGHDPQRTINIHPGPLPLTAGLHGDAVHQRAMQAYQRGEIKYSAVTMHFVTERYDEGPVFFQCPVAIEDGDDWKSLKKRVNAAEHQLQPFMTNLILREIIYCSRVGRKADGSPIFRVVAPEWYGFHKAVLP